MGERDSDEEECAEDGELEYSITFGTRRSDYPNSEDEAEDANTSNAADSAAAAARGAFRIDNVIPVGDYHAKEPVIFLIGWSGCLDKHLAKYSLMYRAAGVTSIRHIPRLSSGGGWFITPADMTRVGHDVTRFLEILTDLDLHENPVFFHVFSNLGMAFYSQVAATLLHSPHGLDVRGAIFDSCPSQPRLSVMINYVMVQAEIEGHSLLRLVLRIITALFCAFSLPVASVLLGYTSIPTLASSPRLEPWPTLYLYSKADVLIPSRDVETSIKGRRARNLSAVSKMFPDSAHVAHLRKYPEEYTSECVAFLSKCLHPQTI